MQRGKVAGMMGAEVGKAAAVTLETLAEARAEVVPSKTKGGSFEVEGAAEAWR